jgi:hypothetical protein
MLVVNLGNGTIIKGRIFDTGKYVEVDEELGKYLIKKYHSKLAIHIVKAPDAMQHANLLNQDNIEDKKITINHVENKVVEDENKPVENSNYPKVKRKYTKRKNKESGTK